MLIPGLHGIDSCGIDAAVSKQIRQTNDIFLYAVEDSCKKVSEIMGEDLFRRHLRCFARFEDLFFSNTPSAAFAEVRE